MNAMESLSFLDPCPDHVNPVFDSREPATRPADEKAIERLLLVRDVICLQGFQAIGSVAKFNKKAIESGIAQ